MKYEEYKEKKRKRSIYKTSTGKTARLSRKYSTTDMDWELWTGEKLKHPVLVEDGGWWSYRTPEEEALYEKIYRENYKPLEAEAVFRTDSETLKYYFSKRLNLVLREIKYTTIHAISCETRIPRTSLQRMLSGKGLPNIESLMRLVIFIEQYIPHFNIYYLFCEEAPKTTDKIDPNKTIKDTFLANQSLVDENPSYYNDDDDYEDYDEFFDDDNDDYDDDYDYDDD